MRIPIPERIKKPNFVWLNSCEHCPTEMGNKFGHDPESIEYASMPERWKRLRHAFACGWRPKGYCHANYKFQYRGVSNSSHQKERV